MSWSNQGYTINETNSSLVVYDEYGQELQSNSIVLYAPPEGHIVDNEGRLLKDPRGLADEDSLPEDIDLYISKFQKIQLSSSMDWKWTTKIPWPEYDFIVELRRMDIYEKQNPHLQIATTDINDSRKIRTLEEWLPIRSLYFLNKSTPMTKDLLMESTGPPRRTKFRPKDKQNIRDLTQWIPMETLPAFMGTAGIPGSSEFFVDYKDLPDRYFISSDPEPALGNRRLYRFAAYSATQYYVLEKNIFHPTLDSEGGSGLTYTIEAGPLLYTRKGWRILSSFYGFDQQIPGSSLYTIYRRNDPFPRMIIALEAIQNPEEWDSSLKFYTFDIPVPGTSKITLQHSLRSIYSNVASIPRHRLTTEDPKLPWEFRMSLYVFSAQLDDCTIFPLPIDEPDDFNYDVI